MEASNEFYNQVHKRLNGDYNKSMNIAWILITIINVSLLMLMIFIQHSKQIIKKLPTNKPARKRKPPASKAA